jgi:hypothetical protein
VKGFVRENPHAVENRTETSGRTDRKGGLRSYFWCHVRAEYYLRIGPDGLTRMITRSSGLERETILVELTRPRDSFIF